MRKVLTIAVSFGLAVSAVAAHAQEWSWEARGALARSNGAAASTSTLLYWDKAYRGTANLPAAFDTRYDLVLRPTYLSGTHVNGSKVYFGMDRSGTIVGGMTPLGEDTCAAEAIGRNATLAAYFGSTSRPIALGALERLRFTPEGGAEQTVCYYPFRLTASEMDGHLAGMKDSDSIRFYVTVDGKVTHTVWSGTDYTPYRMGSSRASQSITVKQYRGLRETVPLIPQ